MAGCFVGYIYYFYCKISQKYYIGQTTRLLNVRVKEHLKQSEKIGKNHFHNALHKYGIDNFEIKIIHIVKKKIKTSQLNKNKIVSLETREKIRKANLGKHHSEETKKKISDITKRCLQNPEYRQKLSESVKRSWVIRKQKLFCNGGSK